VSATYSPDDLVLCVPTKEFNCEVLQVDLIDDDVELRPLADASEFASRAFFVPFTSSHPLYRDVLNAFRDIMPNREVRVRVIRAPYASSPLPLATQDAETIDRLSVGIQILRVWLHDSSVLETRGPMDGSGHCLALCPGAQLSQTALGAKSD
jgi:hypothetical protein